MLLAIERGPQGIDGEDPPDITVELAPNPF